MPSMWWYVDIPFWVIQGIQWYISNSTFTCHTSINIPHLYSIHGFPWGRICTNLTINVSLTFPWFLFPSADGPRSFGCFFDVQWQEIGPSQHQALTIPERSGDPRWFQGPQPPNPFRCYGPIWVRIGGTMHSIHFLNGFSTSIQWKNFPSLLS